MVEKRAGNLSITMGCEREVGRLWGEGIGWGVDGEVGRGVSPCARWVVGLEVDEAVCSVSTQAVNSIAGGRRWGVQGREVGDKVLRETETRAGSQDVMPPHPQQKEMPRCWK